MKGRWSASLVSFLLAVLCVGHVAAQSFDPEKYIAASVQVDSVVIVASRTGFSVEDFIGLVYHDKSLYEAFHNLRSASYVFATSMSFTDRQGDSRATYRGVHRQFYDGRCRRMEVLDEAWTGDFYKGRRQKHRYYTYALYDRLFLTHGEVCNDQVVALEDKDKKSGMEGHVDELKTLIFRPGHRSDLPLIGRKTEIFSEEMIALYDFTIKADTVDGIPVYLFHAEVREEFMDRENQTVFKELTTFFSREDFQVTGRSYQLSQKTLAYMFDVRIDVRLVKQGDRYFPATILYSGEWNIPLKKKEQGTFTIQFSEFQ